VASLLLRSDPPRMRAARLVQWCTLFGVAEGTARVALSRMAERGELRAVDGTYELAGRVGRRRPAQDWALAPRLRTWDGTWRCGLVVGPARAAADRARLRAAMRALRMAPRREGVWVRPDNLPRESAPADAWETADAQCEWWSGEPVVDAAGLARRLFGVDTWAARAGEHRERLTAVTTRLATPGDRSLAAAFVAGAAALAHVRADPLLPPELGPAQAVGDALRDAYGAYERAFSAAVRAWFEAQP
jgi:phenylacetic acid degradation operon negative regulatory protein